MKRKKYTFVKEQTAHNTWLADDELAYKVAELLSEGYMLKSVEDVPEHTLPYKDDDDRLRCPSCWRGGKVFAHVCGYQWAFDVNDDDEIILGSVDGLWIQYWKCHHCGDEFNAPESGLTWRGEGCDG